MRETKHKIVDRLLNEKKVRRSRKELNQLTTEQLRFLLTTQTGGD